MGLANTIRLGALPSHPKVACSLQKMEYIVRVEEVRLTLLVKRNQLKIQSRAKAHASSDYYNKCGKYDARHFADKWNREIDDFVAKMDTEWVLPSNWALKSPDILWRQPRGSRLPKEREKDCPNGPPVLVVG